MEPQVEREQSAIDSPEFKQRFRQSKIADERGEPMKVCHGTDANFGTFVRDHVENGPSKSGF